MIIREAASRNRALIFCLLLGITLIITSACEGSTSLIRPGIFPSNPVTATPLPQNQEASVVSTESVEIIPATGLENLQITGCPDWDAAKMYEGGEHLYGFYCAGCHGRQGVPFTSHFPPLNDSTLAVSEDIAPGLHLMMNTDVHPNANMLFEKDALSVINYIRITFANNTDLICPGEYIIEINP